MRFAGAGQGMITFECVEKRKVSNHYKWKHKDTNIISYHTEA